MKKCRVLQAVGFTRNGKGVTSNWPGTIVEVNDAEAEALVAEGKLEFVDDEPKAEESKDDAPASGGAKAKADESKGDAPASGGSKAKADK